MRELKFRAWEKEDKKYYRLLYIEFGSNGKPIAGKIELSALEDELADIPEQIELEQYTGLKDKNGKEIYEGDIVKYIWAGDFDTGIYEVKYDEERAGFVPFAQGDGCGCCEADTISDSSDVEIVGNIHENPELLEGEE